MAAFVDKYGAPYLPVVDDDGSVPVVDSGEKTDIEPLFEAILTELTAIRMGIQIMLNRGSDEQEDLLALAQNLRDELVNN